LRREDKLRLRQRYAFRCGYCGISEAEVGSELTVDHFHPRSKGGSDLPENHVYCCHYCNESKNDYWQPDSEERILHPEQEDHSLHIHLGNDGRLIGNTPTGVFHISRLRLNRPALVARRAELLGKEQDRAQNRLIASEVSEIRQMLLALQSFVQSRGEPD
jgi:hypothetical protein